MHQYPGLSVFIFMYFALISLGMYISDMPLATKRDNYLAIFNLTIMLYLTYLCLMLTKFVAREFYVAIANQFLYGTMFMIACNVGLVFVEHVIIGYKKYRVWKIQRRNKKHLREMAETRQGLARAKMEQIR